ncbi:MAG TPA: glycosyltransferase family 39 protein [Rhizomicrobium sp.]|jgi:4-amino-4-deoxy-L-arabinose transferase-like glycosyltransferase|nr:glycosyltransferase family 39 protein [Rhizomicrobium sp.]
MIAADDRKLFRITLAIVAAITLVRVIVLIVSPLQLYPDEAQYWWWAQTPDLGYFSKPPLIAWIIWAFTALFGDSEWAMRLASPLLHAGTALLLFGIGRRAFDARTGLWSALAYLTLPGVAYSCGLISTDVPLLFCWALALYAFFRALDDSVWRWAVVCGLAVGFGLLSKYAMAYFFLGAVFAAIASPQARRAVLSLRGLVVLVLALTVLSPNIIWNAQHHFATVGHTESNANWSHAHFSVLNFLNFFGGQFGVFGPILMIGFIAALWRLARGPERPQAELVLASFSLPALLVIIGQSFISDANANWAAPAYIAATPLAVALLLHVWNGRALWASFALHGTAIVLLWAIMVSPPFANTIGLGNAFKRLEGWRELGQAVVAEAKRAPYDAIVTDNRSVVAELLYYGRPRTIPVKVWSQDARVTDHFQMTMPLTPATRRALLVVEPGSAPIVTATFDSVTRVGTSVVPVGGHHTRTELFFDARGYRGPAHTP